MRSSWRKLCRLWRKASHSQVRPATRAERGQALVIIAMAMIGLLAFVGLTVDAGILFIAEGHLRRAVDAAALAAAAEFRVGRTHDQLKQSAEEVVHLNGVDPSSLKLTLCDPTDPTYDDPTQNPGSTLCSGTLHRKLVKVVATVPVRFAFLGIIGIPSTDITASSVSETASVDVVLVIDTSNSMTFDVHQWSDTFQAGPHDVSSYWYPNGPVTSTVGPDGCNQDPQGRSPDASYAGYCLPFDQVKHAAVDFVHHLYWPYDRLAIVTFDRSPTVVEPLTNTDSVDQWTNIIKGLKVSDVRDHQTDPTQCPANPAGQGVDPGGCTNTSIGGGLFLAGGEFGRQPIRQESVWVVILLTDGAANSSYAQGSSANYYCAMSTWQHPIDGLDPVSDPDRYFPYCRANDKTIRHTALNPTVWQTIYPTHTVPFNPASTYDVADYDTSDYAHDAADFVACAPKLAQAQAQKAFWCLDSLDYQHGKGGQGALIYSIGLGQLVIDNPKGGGVAYPGAENNEARIPPADYINKTNLGAGYDAGDYLLRYVANVGADGNPDPSVGPDPCSNYFPTAVTGLIPAPVPTAVGTQDVADVDSQPAPSLPEGNLSYNCGNYYFSQSGAGLNSVFQSIASRIFTRITQ